MQSNLEEVSEEFLRSARPRLICLVELEGDLRFDIKPYARQGEYDHEEVVSEGYDPDHSPLGTPVYWRILDRGDEQFYCSTFLATRDQVKKAWGTAGLTYCDPITGIAFARIETKLPKSHAKSTPPHVSAESNRHALRSDQSIATDRFHPRLIQEQ
jgi:hypothetical protein